jgi:lipopolysaccharide transport system ATP-binding protein
MNDVAIHVENLGKRYRIGERQRYKALRDTLAGALHAPFRVAASLLNGRDGHNHNAPNGLSESEFWALKDLSFDIKKGEAVGIVGHNGAGKSTLLKILSRITKPTEGYVRLNGRVGSLLEVGTGFHPELTGRENIYLNGAIIGMRKKEIDRKFGEIVAFAEIEKFIDTPVKFYSSGMYIRLAFAVAAHLQPDILIIDEVLAVGDAEFQKKCLGKMGNVAKQGRTVLFVSHSMQAVNSLCKLGILLQAGTIVRIGSVGDITKSYLSGPTNDTQNNTRERIWTNVDSAPGTQQIRISRIAVIPEGEDSNSPLEMSTPFRIVLDYWNFVQDVKLIINLYLFAIDGMPVFESLTTDEPNWFGRQHPKGLFRSQCFVPGNLLNAGEFRIQINFLDDRLSKLFVFPEAVFFSVSDTKRRKISAYGRFYGCVHPQLDWRTDLIEHTQAAS